MAGANSFEQSSEKERDRPLRGLLYMIGQLAEHINNTAWTRKASEKKYGTQSLSLWRTHPYLFKAFKVAVSRWLNSLPEPTDEPQIPKFGNHQGYAEISRSGGFWSICGFNFLRVSDVERPAV